jgi:hypothetical protein
LEEGYEQCEGIIQRDRSRVGALLLMIEINFDINVGRDALE